MDFDGGPTPHLHRKFSDYWALKQSGVEIHELTIFVSLEDLGDRVEVKAKISPEADKDGGHLGAPVPAPTAAGRSSHALGPRQQQGTGEVRGWRTAASPRRPRPCTRRLQGHREGLGSEGG